jgi:hypothetical protein
METVGFSKMSATDNNTMWCHNPEEHNLNHILLSYIVEKARYGTLSWASWIYCSRPLYLTSKINVNIFFHALPPHLWFPSGDVLSRFKVSHLSHAWTRNVSLFAKWWRPFTFQDSPSLAYVNMSRLSLSLSSPSGDVLSRFKVSHLSHAWTRNVSLFSKWWRPFTFQDCSFLTFVNTPPLSLSLLQVVTSFHISRFLISHMREYTSSLSPPSGGVLSCFKIPHLSHAWTSFVSLSLFFDYYCLYIICWRVKVFKLLLMQFSSSSYHVLALRPKQTPKHLFLVYHNSIFFPYGDRTCFTSIQTTEEFIILHVSVNTILSRE